MKKKFNVTGTCFPKEHYMADVSNKMQLTYDMIEEGLYFIINRPRQYGKTTTLYTLAPTLRQTGDYLVVSMSFAGLGDLMFESEKIFSNRFVGTLTRYASVQIGRASCRERV